MYSSDLAPLRKLTTEHAETAAASSRRNIQLLDGLRGQDRLLFLPGGPCPKTVILSSEATKNLGRGSRE